MMSEETILPPQEPSESGFDVKISVIVVALRIWCDFTTLSTLSLCKEQSS